MNKGAYPARRCITLVHLKEDGWGGVGAGLYPVAGLTITVLMTVINGLTALVLAMNVWPSSHH